MTETHRRPKAFVLDSEEGPAAARAARKPRTFAGLEFEAEQPVAEVPAPPVPSPRRAMRWGSLLAAALVTFVTLWAGVAITATIEDMFARSPILGWIALVLGGLAGFAALAIAAREILALARLRRIEHIRVTAARALATKSREECGAAVSSLRALYRGRHDAAWGLRLLGEHDRDVMEPADRLRLAERLVLAPFDQEAHRIVARAARRVTLLTTVTPAASLDIAFVAVQNLRMLRELASLYGGRPSGLATMRLARMVVSHLAVTGGLALSDNLLQHLLGKGLAGRLSARFGEGAVNGILTARIGLAAGDVCRPIPKDEARRETLASLLREVFTLGEKRNE